MLIYIIIFLLLFLCQLFFSGSKLVKTIVEVTVVLFFCFSYMNGSDWRQYEPMYLEQLKYGDSILSLNVEPGYRLLMNFFQLFGINFWTFFIGIKVICLIVFMRTIYKITWRYYFLSLAIFLSFFGLYLFIDGPFRNLIAITIAVSALPYYLEQEKKKYFLRVLIASLFHVSALILIPLYYLSNKNYSSKALIKTFLIFVVVLSFFDIVLRPYIPILLSSVPFIGAKIDYYFIDDNFNTGSKFTLGLFLRIILFVLVAHKKEEFEKNFGKVFFNGIVMFFFLYRLSISYPIFMRFTLFFSVFFTISLIGVAVFYSKQFRVLSYTIVFLYLMSNVFIEITNDYRYVPYTNYLEYMFEQKPSYEERYLYNRNKSPYHKE